MENRIPNVFISSTCYDLAQIRDDLKTYIEDIGFYPVLSEHHSFPVAPGTTIVDNCLDAVKDNADIFILIIGGRYGSQFNEGKSITNTEYLTAVRCGIPIYVFLDKEVNSFYKVWKENPDANFSKYVDTPKLFSFINEIQETKNTWIYGFSSAGEICNVLKMQIPYLLKVALNKYKSTNSIKDELIELLPNDCIDLYLEKPINYEMDIFIKLISRELVSYRNQKRDVTYKIRYRSEKGFDDKAEVGKYLGIKMETLSIISQSLVALINDAYSEFYGLPGVPSNIEGLYYVATRYGLLYKNLIEWVIELRSVTIDEKYIALFDAMCDVGIEFLKTIENVETQYLETSREIKRIFKEKTGEKEIKKTIEINIPSETFDKLNAEIHALM